MIDTEAEEKKKLQEEEERLKKLEISQQNKLSKQQDQGTKKNKKDKNQILDKTSNVFGAIDHRELKKQAEIHSR